MFKLILIAVVGVWGYGYIQHPITQTELMGMASKAEADFKTGYDKLSAEIKK